MFRTLIVCLCVALGYAGASPSESWENQFVIVRLSPEQVLDLPDSLRSWLSREEYRIPQTSCIEGFEGIQNVIRGQFLVPGQTDWAVLASRSDTSEVILFPGGAIRSHLTMWRSADRAWLQGGIGYSQLLATADSSRVEGCYAAWERLLPFSLTHDAIEQAFCGKGSRFYYWDEGRWLELEGSD